MEKKVKKTLAGTVVSDKMQKTRVMEIKRRIKHPLFKKYVYQKTAVKFHDEKNESKTGDRVLVEACRPLSKDKCFKLQKIVEAAAR